MNTLVKTVETVAASINLPFQDMMDNVNSLRAVFKSSTERDTTLSDVEIAELIAASEDDKDADAWAECMADAEAAKAGDDTEGNAVDISTVSAQGVSDIGLRFAPKLDTPEWDAFFEKSFESSEHNKQAMVKACMLLQATFTKEERESIPVYGVPLKDEKTGRLNNNPDIYLYNIPGTKRKVPKHRVYDIFDASKKGRDIIGEIERHEKAMNAAKNGGGTADPALVNMGVESLSADISMWKARQTTARRQWREALALDRKMVEITEVLPNLSAKIALDERGQLRRSPMCIRVKSKVNDASQFLTPQTFLKLKLEKAKEMGVNSGIPDGTLADLIATVGKGSGDTGTPASEDKAMPKTALEVLGYVQACNQFAMSGDNDENRKAALAIRALMEGKGGDEAVRAFGKFFMWLDGNVWKHIAERFDDLEAQEIAHMSQHDDKEAKDEKRKQLAEAFKKGVAA